MTLLAAVRRVRPLREPATNLCLAIREQQNNGYLPDGTTRLSIDGEPLRHFMGTSTFAEYTVMPEIALAKIDPEAPLERACLFACGLSTGLGAAMRTAASGRGPRASCSGPGWSASAPSRAAGCRGGTHRLRRPLAERLELARGQGATDPMQGGPERSRRARDDGGFGADYTFEATGNVA